MKSSATAMQARLAALFPAAFALGLMTMPAAAQQAQGNAPEGWFKVCSKQENNDICNTQFQQVAGTGQVLTAISLIEVTGDVNRRVFQLTVPTGRLIPAGIKLSVDDKQNTTIPYVLCFPQSCIAEVQLDDALVGVLKAGGKLTVTSTNYQNNENPIEITLAGFTAAYDGPPLGQAELESRQRELQEELRRKAEEARQKLQEAQEAAKDSAAQ